MDAKDKNGVAEAQFGKDLALGGVQPAGGIASPRGIGQVDKDHALDRGTRCAAVRRWTRENGARKDMVGLDCGRRRALLGGEDASQSDKRHDGERQGLWNRH
ncbi:MAG TPA: hypothetical protein VGG72_03805 [Bryobacteraceae bacterium]